MKYSPHHMGIENNTQQKSGVRTLAPHRYRKQYPALKGEGTTPSRVSKTIPSKKVECEHLPPIGIENNTQHSKEKAPRHHGYQKQYPAKKWSANTRPIGIENNTQLRMFPSSHGYRKRYPALKGECTTPSRVSKTIPSKKVKCEHLPPP